MPTPKPLRNLSQRLATFWHTLSYLGIGPDMPPVLRPKVVLCNRIGITAGVAVMLTSLQFFAAPTLLGMYLVASAVYASAAFWNLLGYHHLARYVLVYLPPVFILLGAGLATDGPSDNLRLALLSVPVSPLVLFQLSEPRRLAMGLAWIALAFVLFDPLTQAIPRLAEIPNDQVFDQTVAQVLQGLMSIGLYVAGFLYQQRQNQATARQLAEALRIAEEQTQIIRRQHDQLQQQLAAIEEQHQAIGEMNHELRLQALKAQINPHFVFNALNSIQHFVMQKSPLEAVGYLSKFAKLIRQVLENSVNERVSVADELKALRDYLDLEQLRFAGAFTYHIEVDEQVDAYNTDIPAMLLQPYVENAILHGLRHRQAPGGLLKIWVLYHFDHLLCVVEDNGIGRAAAAALAARRSAPDHVSRGTTVTNKRLHLLNDEVGVVTLDRYTPDQQPAGTRVEITIPLET
jgi:hypothetical protein